MNHSTLTWEPQVNLYLNPLRNNQPKENGPPLNGVKNRLPKKPTKCTTFSKPSMPTTACNNIRTSFRRKRQEFWGCRSREFCRKHSHRSWLSSFRFRAGLVTCGQKLRPPVTCLMPWRIHELRMICLAGVWSGKSTTNFHQVVAYLALSNSTRLRTGDFWEDDSPNPYNHDSSKSRRYLFNTPLFPNPALHSLMVLFRSSNPGPYQILLC